MEPNKIVNQEYKVLLPVRPSKSASISVKNNGTTNTSISTSLHGLLRMCLYEAVITILCLHLSLMIYMHKNISYNLYESIFTVVHLILSLPVSLWNGIL